MLLRIDRLILVALLVLSVECIGWNSVYLLSQGHIYVQLKNNELVRLNISITGLDDKNTKFGTEDLNLKTGQSITSLASPPANSTIFSANEELYGAYGKKADDDTKDVCGNGILKLTKYNPDKNEWNDVEGLKFDGVNDGSYYQFATYLGSPRSKEVYIYGGQCKENDDITKRLISVDLDKMTVSNITTSTKPQPFYGATNLLAPDMETQLIIGGQSNHGWINMYQVATWNIDSGWSFQVISHNDNEDKVNSRRFALSLPIFLKLSNSSQEYIRKNYEVEEVLLIGGELLKTDSTPEVAKLSVKPNDYSWTAVKEPGFNASNILGAATIFDTLVVINETSSTHKSKRDGLAGKYSLELYDTTNFKTITELKQSSANKNSNTQSSSSSGVQTKAIVGTLVPVCALVMAASAAIFFVKRRKHNKEVDEKNNTDYNFLVPYYDFNGDSVREPRVYNKPELADSNSTIDMASIDSWVRKRDEFEKQRKPYILSPMNSAETLSEPNSHYSPADTMPNAINTSPQSPSYAQNLGLINRSVSKFRKSIPVRSSPVMNKPHFQYFSLPSKPPRVTHIRNKLSDNDLEELGLPEINSPPRQPPRHASKPSQDSESDRSLYDKLDAQVLVSSKRRSVLRVMNPDFDDSKSEKEKDITSSPTDSSQHSTTVRQRIPSGDSTRGTDKT